jgi:hypothetical protein
MTDSLIFAAAGVRQGSGQRTRSPHRSERSAIDPAANALRQYLVAGVTTFGFCLSVLTGRRESSCLT